ncbi:MAG TPA: MFS transporter [Hyphomicrobium sp.]|nr:MFS transporter [Hyphomicrobium sp.]
MTASTEAVAISAENRRKSLIAVVLSCFGVGIAFGLGYPLTAMALEARGEPSWIIGLAGAAPSLAILLLLPILPHAVARIQPATAIILGCVCCAVAYASLYFIDNTFAWIALRFLMGATIALPWIVGETWVNHIAGDTHRARVISFYAVSFFSGFALGPMLLEYFGATGPMAYAIGALGALLAALPIYLARDLAPDLAHEPATGLIGGMRLAPAAMAGGFLGGFLETSHFSLLPNVAIAGGMEEGAALRLMTALVVGGIVTQYTLGWLADRTSRKLLLAALGLIYAALIAIFPLVLGTPVFALVVIFVMGTTVIGLYMLGLAMLGQEVEPSQLATANAAFILMYTSGSIVGPALTGAAMTNGPIAGFVGVTGAAALILAAVIAFSRGRAA